MNAPNHITRETTILELIVKNHPGVMSHVCGLFSRRAYNLEGIAVLPIGDSRKSRIWLKVIEEQNLDQIIKQIKKLPDIKCVTKHTEEKTIFTEIAHYFTE